MSLFCIEVLSRHDGEVVTAVIERDPASAGMSDCRLSIAPPMTEKVWAMVERSTHPAWEIIDHTRPTSSRGG